MPHWFFVLLRVAYLITLVVVCGYALWRGGRDERLVAFAQIATSLASGAVVSMRGMPGWYPGQPALLGIDMIMLAVLVAVALRSSAYWPIWAAGFHLDAVLTHAAKLLAPATLSSGYAIVQGFWAYPLMAALWVGTYRHAHEARAAERRAIAGPGG